MKRIVGIVTIVLALIIMTGLRAEAQDLKFGHINSEEIMQAMPATDSATATLEAFRQELINELELMSVELNNKSEAYNKISSTLTSIVKQNKEAELMDMQRRSQEFQANAQQLLQAKQMELFQPIYAKVDKAIKDVGKENGFIYIFDISKGSLLYFDETKSTNLVALTKAKLGLK
jgi:outer membrane protein